MLIKGAGKAEFGPVSNFSQKETGRSRFLSQEQPVD